MGMQRMSKTTWFSQRNLFQLSIINCPLSTIHHRLPMITCFVMLPFITCAQIKDDSLRLVYKAGITGSVQSGNLNQVRVAGTLQGRYHSANRRFGINESYSYNYSKIEKRTLQNDVLNHTLFYYKTNPRFFPIGILWVQKSQLLDYKLAAPGIGMLSPLVDNRKHYLSIAALVTYEWKRSGVAIYNDAAYNGNADLNTPRAMLRINGLHTITDAKLHLNYEAYVMPSLRWKDNYRFYGSASAEVPLWRRLNIKVAYTYSYENVVVAKRTTTDQALTFGISYGNMR